jgi:hypothetical protein
MRHNLRLGEVFTTCLTACHGAGDSSSVLNATTSAIIVLCI